LREGVHKTPSQNHNSSEEKKVADEAQSSKSKTEEAAAADANQVDADESPAKKALAAQMNAEPAGPVKTYNPSYSSPDEEEAGEYVGVSPEYRNAANETEVPLPFEGVEGENVEKLSEATDGSEVVPFPVEHSDDAPTKKTAAARR
jgi:hypothetical protein